MGGKSQSSNASTNNSVNTSNSVGIQGDGNFALSGVGGDVNYSVTDHGSIEMAGELASESLGLAGHSVDSALSFGSDALGLAGSATENALQFGAGALSSALDSNNSAVDGALSFGAGALDGALSFGSEMFGGALDSINQMANSQSNLASQSMQLANSVNASAATQGASDLNAQNTKVIVAGVGLVALVLIVFMFKK